MADLAGLIADLTAEGTDLDALVADLDEDGWARPTPSPPWTIAHQIAHLAWTDQVALLAIEDAEAFAEALQAAADNPFGYVDKAADDGAALPRNEALAAWRAGRADLAASLAAVPDGTKIPWFGPPMSAASMATARLMESWAHGLDVADALGVQRPATDRIKNVAHLGVRTRNFSFMVRNEPMPADEFRVELAAPSGEIWAWGPEDAAQRVTGSALDFCMLVTQRRNRSDLDLVATGADAERWLDIAQAFAGPPGEGRAPAGAGDLDTAGTS